TLTRVGKSLLLSFAVFVLLQGHHEPGGGFVAGLLVAGAFVLHVIGFGTESTRRALKLEPRTWMAVGLLLALASSAWPLLVGRPYFKSGWVEISPFERAHVALGSPFLFDVGVFMVVVGTVLGIVLSLAEE
ncbi:MAG: MnhB domain-containing protein, partial [Myxococcales bacterium]